MRPQQSPAWSGAYHVILSAYGFWLPNDPRGSWSDFVWSWELAKFGPATKVSTRPLPRRRPTRSPTPSPLAAQSALHYPPVSPSPKAINAAPSPTASNTPSPDPDSSSLRLAPSSPNTSTSSSPATPTPSSASASSSKAKPPNPSAPKTSTPSKTSSSATTNPIPPGPTKAGTSTSIQKKTSTAPSATSTKTPQKKANPANTGPSQPAHSRRLSLHPPQLPRLAALLRSTPPGAAPAAARLQPAPPCPIKKPRPIGSPNNIPGHVHPLRRLVRTRNTTNSPCALPPPNSPPSTFSGSGCIRNATRHCTCGIDTNGVTAHSQSSSWSNQHPRSPPGPPTQRCDRQPSAFLYSPFDTSTILHMHPARNT